MSLAKSLGDLPNTRLNGDSLSADNDGVILEANEISVSRLDHCGADFLADRIFYSEVSVLCCDSHSPLVRGWYGVVLTCLISRHWHTEVTTPS